MNLMIPNVGLNDNRVAQVHFNSELSVELVKLVLEFHVHSIDSDDYAVYRIELRDFGSAYRDALLARLRTLDGINEYLHKAALVPAAAVADPLPQQHPLLGVSLNRSLHYLFYTSSTSKSSLTTLIYQWSDREWCESEQRYVGDINVWRYTCFDTAHNRMLLQELPTNPDLLSVVLSDCEKCECNEYGV